MLIVDLSSCREENLFSLIAARVAVSLTKVTDCWLWHRKSYSVVSIVWARKQIKLFLKLSFKFVLSVVPEGMPFCYLNKEGLSSVQ